MHILVLNGSPGRTETPPLWWRHLRRARHIDLYDDVAKIPFDKLEHIFKTNLKINQL